MLLTRVRFRLHERERAARGEKGETEGGSGGWGQAVRRLGEDEEEDEEEEEGEEEEPRRRSAGASEAQLPDDEP